MRHIFTLPPGIGCKAAIVVLGAEGNLKRFAGKVYAMLAVEGDGAGVHALKPRNGRAFERAALFKVVVRLCGKGCKVEARRFAAVVEEDAPPLD